MAKMFSMKEAIGHGFRMTKKYFGVVFAVMMVFAAHQIIQGVLSYRAGDNITKDNVTALYNNPTDADSFYTYLIETGYINTYGSVQDKLQTVTSPADLTLSEKYEPDRVTIYNFLERFRYRLPFPRAIFILLSIALWVIGVLMQIGFLKIAISLSRDQKPAVSELFTNGSFFLKFILASICYGLAVIGGLILLIVPGIIFMVALGFYSYFIVDKNMRPIESLKASRVMTKGARWQLFVFGILLVLVNVGGFICLFVGLIFTIPATSIAYASVYDKLAKREEPVAV